MSEILKDFFVQYGTAILVVFFVLMFFCFFGCSPKIVTQIQKEYLHDTLKVIQKDSVYLEKLDTIKMFQKNDTIFLEKIKWRNSYQIKELHDTTKVVQVDIKEKEIPVKYTPKFFKICTISFWILILLLILFLCLKIKKKSLF